MKTSDFNYELPSELIAQKPLLDRDSSRLLNLSRTDGGISHHHFNELPTLLRPKDRLVFNDTRVYPARLFVRKDNGVRIEILFTQKVNDFQWKAIAKPARRLKRGGLVTLESAPEITLAVADVYSDGSRLIASKEIFLVDLLKRYGTMPLPPYIERDATDLDRNAYQTVYAKKDGAIAAPTAGLHFTNKLIDKLEFMGVTRSSLTLHVGIGTFRPVKETNPLDHPMHTETYELPSQTVDDILQTKRDGGRVIAVGTTVVRVLEHCAVDSSSLRSGSGETKLMILDGYEFKVVDAMITNFHLPQSTLLMLVSAFANRKSILNAYNLAVHKKYRFFSYGDAMFIS